MSVVKYYPTGILPSDDTAGESGRRLNTAGESGRRSKPFQVECGRRPGKMLNTGYFEL